eukprot:c9441_g1_i1.p1 GENE.c9441_g1_i1~~c9441_g1_i1.p1  ORF type:complete len:1632 (+),score=497.05 c9441_g1_i1:1-4896(+)
MGVDGIDDKAEFATVHAALKTYSMSENGELEVFKILAGILHMGNIVFEESGQDGSRASDANLALSTTCKLFGWDAEAFQKAVCFRVIGVGTAAECVKPRTVSESEHARDGIAKAIYEQLFNWIVKKLNENIRKDETDRVNRFIGVLDIYGFEQFEFNSFEQLCINYANEKLQQFFNAYIFKEEQKAAKQEHIDFEGVQFEDNQPTIDLFEESDGVYQMLDQTLFMNGTDSSFLNNLNSINRNGKYGAYFVPKTSQTDSFGVRHFAGDVVYGVANFVEKNRDTLDADLIRLVQSGVPFMQELFDTPEFRTLTSSGDPRGRKSMGKLQTSASLGKRYQMQLRDLMTVIEGTNPHFVRCIKPNSQKKPKEMEPMLIIHQLRYAGFLEAIRIRRLGYPVRRPFRAFIQRYKIIVPQVDPNMDAQQLCTYIISSVPNLPVGPPSGVQVGLRRVFMKQTHVNILEEARQRALISSVVRVQSLGRKARARRGYSERLKVQKKIKTAVLDSTARESAVINSLVHQIGELKMQNHRTKQLLELAKEVSAVMTRVTATRAAFDVSGLDRALADAQKLQLADAVLNEARVFKDKLQSLLKDVQKAIQSQDLDQLEQVTSLSRELNFTNELVAQAEKLRDRLQQELPLEATLKRSIATQNRFDVAEALRKADALGFHSPAVDEARLVLARLEEIEKIKAGLIAAITSRDLEAMESNLTKAHSMKLPRDITIEQAEADVLVLRKEAQVLKVVRIAIQSRGLEQLNKAIELAAQNNVRHVDVQKAIDIREEVLMESGVTELLQKALKSRNRADLEGAIHKAEELGLHNEQVELAEELLEEIETTETILKSIEKAVTSGNMDELEKALATAYQVKIVGPKVTEAQQLLQDMREAVEAVKEGVTTRKLQATQQALSRAKALRMENVPVVVEAEKLVAQLEKEARAINQLQLAMSNRSLPQISEAMKVCRTVGLSDSHYDMLEAERTVSSLNKELSEMLQGMQVTLQSKELEIGEYKQRMNHTVERLSGVEGEKVALKQRVDDLQKRLEEAETQSHAREVNNQLLQSQITELNAKLSTVREERDSKSNEAELLSQKLSGEHSRVQELEQDGVSLRRSLDDLRAKQAQDTMLWTQKEFQLNSDVRTLTDKSNTLQIELDRVRLELTSTNQRLTIANDRITELSHLKDQLIQQKEAAEVAVNEGRIALQQIQSQILADREKALEAQRSRVQEQGAVDRRITELEGQLNIKNIEIDGFKQRLEYASDRVQDLTRQRDENRAAKEVSDAKVHESEVKAQQLDLQLTQERLTCSQLQTRIQKLETDLESEKQQHAAASARIIELEGERDNLKQRLATTESIKVQHEERINSLTGQVERDQARIKQEEEAQTVLKDQLQRSQVEFDAHKQRAAEKAAEAEKVRQELEAAVAECRQQLANESARMLEMKLKLEEQIQQGMIKQASLQSQLESRQEELHQVNLNLHTAQERIEEVTKEHESVKSILVHKLQEEKELKDNTPYFQGWLKKSGGNIGTVKRRYFVLRANYLYYYSSNSSTNDPQGVIYLTGIDVKQLGKKSNGYGIELLPTNANGKVTSSKRRGSSGGMTQGSHTSFVFFTETEAEMEGWFNALKRCIQEHPVEPARHQDSTHLLVPE